MTKRYAQLIPIINAIKPVIIVEIGTWNGLRAIEMCTAALQHNQGVKYYGFDVFTLPDEGLDKRELNVKPRVPFGQVAATLEEFHKLHPGFEYKLIEGDTRETLKEFRDSPCDFAFVDGGHSIETIASDLENLAGAKVLVVDDYYTKDPEGKCPDITKHGANLSVDGREEWVILPQADPVKDGGRVQMAVRGFKPQVNVIVKTKNCVPDEQIRDQIAYATSKGFPVIPECRAHDQIALFCSAGPSLIGQLDRIVEAAKRPGTRLVCVKHAHDLLLEVGIVPWACVLLDPRDHVRDFIENPHPAVTYLTASMVHTTTIDRLLAKQARVWLYHAHVGAGEEKILTGGFMVGGGSSASMRGISVLHTLGFRKVLCFGYDSCYWKKPDMSVLAENGQPKHMKVSVAGRDFWTDGELLAQAQDFERLVKQATVIDLEVHGYGMIPHIYRHLQGAKADFFATVGK